MTCRFFRRPTQLNTIGIRIVTTVLSSISATGANALPPESRADDTNVVLILVILAIVFIYLLPAIVAFSRRRPNRWIILVVNVVFGGTGLGWLGSLVWAFNAVHKSSTGSDGGESGLNLFVNDAVKVVLDVPVATVDADPIAQLQRLKTLRDEGVITDEELSRLKKPLFDSL